MAAAQASNVYWIWKYLPLIIPSVLVIIPWITPHLGEPDPPKHISISADWTVIGPNLAHKSADIAFALLNFWLWALTTNAHTRCFVSSGGEIKARKGDAGDQEKMQRELAQIIVLGAITCIGYLLCNTKDLWTYGLFMVFASFFFPFFILVPGSKTE